MKWFKKFEDFKRDELEIETPIDKTLDVAQMDTEEKMKDEKDLETSDSYIDELGVVHISDWNKY
jgi:hypothetical protein